MMIEALLLLNRGRPAQVRELLRIAIGAPFVIVLWYEVAGLFINGATVALVALFLAFFYGGLMIVLTAKLTASGIGGAVGRAETLVRDIGHRAATASRVDQALSDYFRHEVGEDPPATNGGAQGHAPSTRVRFPLEG